jgi:hypothetical protein
MLRQALCSALDKAGNPYFCCAADEKSVFLKQAGPFPPECCQQDGDPTEVTVQLSAASAIGGQAFQKIETRFVEIARRAVGAAQAPHGNWYLCYPTKKVNGRLGAAAWEAV